MHPTIPKPSSRRRGFTLIELLTVIAIIGILAAILFPAINNALKHAHKAAVKNQFGQWVVAIQSYKADYSYYPQLDGNLGSTAGSANIVNPQKFAIALTGNNLDGTAVAVSASASDVVGNTKRRLYYTLSQSELSFSGAVPVNLLDAFNNTQFAYLYDSNGDGLIKSDDKVANGASQTAPAVISVNGGKFTPDPKVDVDLSGGIRAGAIFYDAGAGNADGTPIDSTTAVFSWK